MTTDLLKEALLDARKLREVAEHEAKASIMEALAPEIRRMLLKEIGEGSPEQLPDSSGFLFPEEEESVSTPPSNGSASLPSVPPSGGGGSGLPVAVQGAAEGLGMALPDSDGRLVVDFDALFVPVSAAEVEAGQSQGGALPGVVGSAAAVNVGDLASTPVGDVALPTPTPGVSAPPSPGELGPGGMATVPPGEGEVPPPPAVVSAPPEATPEEERIEQTPMATLEAWTRNLMVIKEAVDQVVARTSPPPEVAQEALKAKIFKAYDGLCEIAKTSGIDQKTLKLNESRLDFLFRVLKEAETGSIYSRDMSKKMPSLTEIQKTLFAEGTTGFDDPPSHKFTPTDSVSTGDTGMLVDKEKTAHAEKVSGVAPGVDLFEENLDKALQEMADALKEETSSAKAQATTPGANPALVKAGSPFDTKAGTRLEDLPENTVLEISEAELKEAIVALRKESLKKQLKSIRESAMKELETSAKEKDWEDQKEPEGGKDPSHANLKEEGDVDMGGGDAPEGGSIPMESVMEPDLAGGEETLDVPLDLALTLNIDNVDTLEIVTDDEEMVKALAGAETETGEEAEEGDSSLELLDDSDEAEGDEVVGDEVALTDEPADDGEGSGLFGSGDDKDDEDKMKETGVKTEGKAKTKATTPTSEVGKLKKQLQEQNLFLGKVLYLNKFLQAEGLSKKQRVKIAGFLDKATSVSDLKETAKKIEKVLEENAKKMAKAAGGKTTGAAVPPVVENVQPSKSTGEVQTLTEGATRQPGLPPEIASMTLDFGKWMSALRVGPKNPA